MRYAEAMEIMNSNPMSKTILPRKHEEEKKLQFYTKEEMAHFFECLKLFGNYKQLAFFKILAFTGVQKSEALSLQWKDINLFNKNVSIGKTLALDENTQVIVQSPKTAKSIRQISLDDETLKILSNWRSFQRQDYLKMGFNTTSENQYVFTNIRMNYIILKL